MTTPPFSEKLLDELIGNARTGTDVFGPDGLLHSLQKALLNRMLDAEMTHTLGYARQEDKPENQDNCRNGHYTKTVTTAAGRLPVKVPRDRQGRHEPQIVPKGVRRLPGFDEKVLSLYARGMSLSEIQGHLEDLYQVEVSRELLSTVTDAVLEDVNAWATRPLQSVYPIVYIDALFFNVRQDGRVLRKAAHLVLGVDVNGKRDVLGLWINETEGAKFWLSVLNDLKNRGVDHLIFVCADGLKGLPEAIQAVFPKSTVQLCIVHLLRNAFHYASWKDRKSIAKDLKPVYTANNEAAAKNALNDFKEKWNKKYPNIAQLFERHWVNFIPFLEFPAHLRKTLYTTNAIESLHSQLRKITDNKRIFPHDDAVRKVLYLALKNIQKKWTMPLRDWKLTLAQLQILCPDAFHTQNS
jgi:transposase-like protein